jgi:hypothetical protein
MAVALTAGCAASAKPAQLSRFPEIKPQYRPVAEQMEDNPVACLQDKLEECKALQDYTLTFYRQERLGGALKPMEKIQAWFRSEPFSVKFVWNNPEANYEEAVFVNGENENKLLVKERKGFLFLPPTTRAIDPALPAKLGKAKNPITSFGLARMIERSLAPIRDPEIADQVTLDYKGIVKLDTEGVPAHHLQINRPTNDEWIHVRQDIFINAQTTLPAGTDLWKTEEKLDARYRYIDINTNIELTDENFVISEDDENAQASAE